MSFLDLSNRIKVEKRKLSQRIAPLYTSEVNLAALATQLIVFLRLSSIASRLSARLSNNSPRHGNTNCATMHSIGISIPLWSSAIFPMFSSQEYRDFDIEFPHSIGLLQSPYFQLTPYNQPLHLDISGHHGTTRETYRRRHWPSF